MKTSFSVKVTGSITVSIEPSNGGDNGGGAAADVDDGTNIAVDVSLESFMKPLVEEAIKKYVHNGALVRNGDDVNDGVEEEEVAPSNYYSDVDVNVDDDDDDDDDDAKAEDGVGDLPTKEEEVGTHVEIDNEYEEDNQLSQKMSMMYLCRRY
jgi:hypothetical protein